MEERIIMSISSEALGGSGICNLGPRLSRMGFTVHGW